MRRRSTTWGRGETLTLHSAHTPGAQYSAFQANLQREIARCLGVTVESLTMDHTQATYSSVRMAGATIWPITVRRRQRIVAPLAQGIYEAWLDEGIAEGRIPFKGGYRAFAANRAAVSAADWQGPARPSADPFKDANADKVRLEMGAATLQQICAERGADWEEVLDQIARENARFDEMGIRSPFGRSTGGAGGPLGGAIEGQRTPAND